MLQSNESTNKDLNTSEIRKGLNESTASTTKDISILNVFCVVNTAQIVYTALQTLTKDMLTYRDVTAFEFACARSCFNAVGSAIIVHYSNEAFFSSIPRNLRSVVVLRCLCGTFAFLCFVSAPKYIPLGIFFVVFNASVFTSALLAYLFLSEKMTCVELIAMVFAFSGILMLGYAKDNTDSPSEEGPSREMF